MRFNTLHAWLEWLEQRHHKSIDLGLDRLSVVMQRLDVTPFDAKVITVAGTNGKGSFVASAAALLRAHDFKVATYTSPHLLLFNERINLDGKMVSDPQLLEAFEKVDQCCQDVSLTYFEFTTLAAFYIFSRHSFDYIILEVGLGGRLDAVNVIAPDYAIITSIGLDHQEYLGSDRSSIAFEKCGILRDKTPLICAEIDPPANLLENVNKHKGLLLGRDFFVHESDDVWSVSAPHLFPGIIELKPNGLSVPSQAAAICLLYLFMGENVVQHCIQTVLNGLSLEGRFQRFEHNEVTIILDVAHNVQAVSMLQSRLDKMPLAANNKRIAVFNMLADKDIELIIEQLHKSFDAWFIGELASPRAFKAETVASLLRAKGVHKISCSKNVRQAYARALSICHPDDQIVAFGSFYVVSELITRLSKL